MKRFFKHIFGFLLVIIIFSNIISGCSDSTQENSLSKNISTITTTVEKDVFLDALFDTMSDTFKITKISESPAKDENITIITYSIINPNIPFMSNIHFSVNYNDKNLITNMNITASPDEYLWCCIALNNIVLALDTNIDIEKFDKDCGLVPYTEDDINIDTNLFSAFKMSSDNFVSISISIK